MIQIIQIALLVAGSVAILFLIAGGYRYIVARGNEEAVEAAKKTISGAILGLVIIILSFTIITVIAQVLLQGRAGLGGV